MTSPSMENIHKGGWCWVLLDRWFFEVHKHLLVILNLLKVMEGWGCLERFNLLQLETGDLSEGCVFPPCSCHMMQQTNI